MRPWALGAAVSLFYLSFHSAFYNFDGVACAIAVDLGDWKHLLHGNHLAYGALGRAFYRLWQLLGYKGGSLLSLQTMDSLLGGASAAVFLSALRRAGLPAALSLAASIGLAFSQAFWIWSLEAQVYMLGTLFAALALREGLGERPRPQRLGLWLGLAVLGHIGHAMLAPVCVYWVWSRDRRALSSALLRLGGSAGAVLLLAYAAAAAAMRLGSAREWTLWLAGSLAIRPDRELEWLGGYSFSNLWEWARMSLRIFVDPLTMSAAARPFAWLLGGAALAAAALGLRHALPRRGEARERRLAVAAALWIASYALLFASWQPFTVVYRVPDLLPLWLLAALALRRFGRAGLAAAAVWAALAGLLNWRQTVRASCDPARNAPYQDAMFVSRAAPEQAWVVVWGLGQVYVPYFAGRRPVNLRYLDKERGALERRLDALAAAGQPVVVTHETLSAGPWSPWLRAYGLEEIAAEGGRRLYRVRRAARRASPRAGAGKG